MRFFLFLSGLYLLSFGTYVARKELNRHSAQDQELHDYRAASLQLRLLELK